MKKKILIFLLTAAVTASLLAGCGNTADTDESGSVAAGEADTDEADAENAAQDADEAEGSGTEENAQDEDADTEPTESGEMEEAEVPEVPEEPEPESANWLEEHEIAITPQGDCSVVFYAYDSYVEDYVDDFAADVKGAISETTEGVDEGLKKVSVLYTIDISDSPSNGVTWQTSAFDRNTGTYFRVNNKTKEAIRIGDEYYVVRTELEQVNDDPLYYITQTVICPVDFDGTVFRIGYITPELTDQNAKIDYQARLYTMDELPYWGEKAQYFTLTDD